MTTRFELFHDDDDTWAIIDKFTGWLAKNGDQLYMGMDEEKAKNVVEVLNFLDARKRQANESGAAS
ncbi:hypothetical protein LJR030_004096 [Rhizobium sp. LjRoot30]|uniref:hypothetical protein n=1 Tax=Rhizobium sp. LjRoot30 TaxID=3342320 RepID=UPI003ED0A614